MSNSDKVYLYGASGHGKVIKDIAEALGVSVEGFVDDNPNLSHYCEKDVCHQAEGLSPIIVSIGINKTRKMIVEKLKCQFATAIHPTAIVSPSATIGEGTVVMPGAIINADAVIGKHCIINTGASVDHECVLGDYCHIAPHASLCGQVHIGEGTLIGVGASVIPCIEIGEWCTIGAGAAVVENVQDGKTVVGVPAKELKKNDLTIQRRGDGKSLIINILQKPLAERSSMRLKDIAIFGVGGFGREVLALIKDINKVTLTYNIVGFFDDGYEKGVMVNGYPTLGTAEELNKWETPISLAVSIGNPIIKKKVLDKITNPLVDYPTLTHPLAWIGDKEYVEIGKGCIICAGTLITTNIKIEDFVILNLGCTVGHDVVIKNYAAFMPSVNISGEVTIGEGVYVGTGAKIINQLEIGDHTIVGAGAVVAKTLPSRCTAVGVPARVIKVHE